MKESTIDALSYILSANDSSTGFRRADIPSELLGSDFIESDFRPPSRCPVETGCKEFCEVSAEDGEDTEVLIKCDAGHSKQAYKDEFTQYDIEFETVLQAVSEVIEQTILAYDDTRLPRYAFAETKSGLNIYLIVNPSEFQNTINEICVDALTDESAALLIAPDKKIKQLLEQKALFSSSNLIYSVPFSMLTEEVEIQSSLSVIQDIQNLEQSFMDDIVDDEGIVQRVNSNPRYILTELNHMRLLRLGKELPQSSGTRLEKIAESAFGHLFTTQADRGGEDDRGENLPDSVFYISDDSLPSGYNSVLGVADAKSGKDAGFGDEPVDGKHEEYIKEARDQSVGGKKIAHTFVVLDFDGHQDIDFFDRMEEVYNDNEYMVVFTAEALAMTLSAYLSYTVSNDLSLVRGSFRTVVYPLFDPDRFNGGELGLGELTREVGRNQPTYDNQYKQRSDLLIVTPEVIRQLFERFAESPKEIQRIFENYYKPRATL